MSKLSFICSFKSDELRSLALPVEVRKPNLKLVAQTLTSESVTLEPGTYHVTASLPAGQRLYNQITIVEDRDATVNLTLDPADVSPNESQEVQRYILEQPSAPASARSPLEGLGAEEIVAKLRAIGGNVLQGPAVAMNAQDWFEPVKDTPSRGVAKFNCHFGDVKFAQLLQAKAPPINIALPISPQRGCQLVLTRLPDGKVSIAVHLENLMADTLLRYYGQGFMNRTASVTTSSDLSEDREILKIQGLLADKVRDPIAAALGAYTLLRLGDLEQLQDWTKNLRDWFEWLPDGFPIRAEHLARLGEHQRALRCLLALPSRGLPIFSDGLSYAIKRLRLYVSFGKLSKSEYLENLPTAIITLEQLERFANFVDFSKPILTFTGLKLDEPDDEALSDDIDDFEGLDLSQYLG